MSSFKDLDILLERLVDTIVPGCGIMIKKNGETVYENYLGKADIESGRDVAADSVYRLFSMSKVITCTAALKEFERGRFLLDDPVSDYIPEFSEMKVAEVRPSGAYLIRPAKNQMLIRHLFNMTNGIPYVYGESLTEKHVARVQNELRAGGDFTIQDYVRRLAKEVPLRFDPGTHYAYGHGHDILAALVEVTSDMKYGEYLAKEIFDPLDMTETSHRLEGDMADRLVTNYLIDSNGAFVPKEAPNEDFYTPGCTYEGGGSGLLSTVRDYMKFAGMLAGGGIGNGNKIIGKRTVDLMRTNSLAPDILKEFSQNYNTGYGYGLGVRTLISRGGVTNESLGSFGWSGLLGTYVAIDPSEDMAIVYMQQTDPNNEEFIQRRIRNVVYGCID